MQKPSIAEPPAASPLTVIATSGSLVTAGVIAKVATGCAVSSTTESDAASLTFPAASRVKPNRVFSPSGPGSVAVVGGLPTKHTSAAAGGAEDGFTQ